MPQVPSVTSESRAPARDTGRIDRRALAGGLRAPVASRGFSLLDLLVSIAVISILIAILLPVLGHVTEATKRVVCQSNARQFGLGLEMYSRDHDSRLPSSVYSGAFPAPQNMMVVRVDDGHWDGVGKLFPADYLGSPEVYYCPSHTGKHTLDRYAEAWNAPEGEIVGNYHFRSIPRSKAFLPDIDPSVTLLADGMQTKEDYNHLVGANTLKADLSVRWFADPEGLLASTLPTEIALGVSGGSGQMQAQQVAEAWYILDNGTDEGFNGQMFPGAGPGNFSLTGTGGWR